MPTRRAGRLSSAAASEDSIGGPFRGELELREGLLEIYPGDGKAYTRIGYRGGIGVVNQVSGRFLGRSVLSVSDQEHLTTGRASRGTYNMHGGVGVFKTINAGQGGVGVINLRV